MYMYIDVGTRTRNITNIIDGTVYSRQNLKCLNHGKDFSKCLVLVAIAFE